ncbi:MAG TPA: SAM-dependent methyltransferase [Anaerolineae bacterium]|nr:SAM-dependent methyltransferase [Anaerolineae bacterium]HPL28255.1 SAM-dependent methyltransferase [Anaerolineae bacterium]
MAFVPVDFETESLSARLEEAGLRRQQKSLFILEGLLMYLRPGAVEELFRTIQGYAGPGSSVVFDYVRASVLRGEAHGDGEREIVARVTQAHELWHFGLETDDIGDLLAAYGLRLAEHRDATALEEAYFRNPSGKIVGHVNGTHCLVTAEMVQAHTAWEQPAR